MDSKKPQPSAYDKFFAKDKNKKYARDAEVAFRGALFIVVAGIPFFLPRNHVEDHAQDMYHVVSDGWYTQFAISCFLFAYYGDLGTTVNLAISGTAGVYLAVLGSWTLFGFFPESITPESSNTMYAIAFGYGAFFVFIMLLLNVNTNTTVFAVSSFVWYLMQFMKPVGTANFAVGFEIDLKGYATKEFIGSFTGSCLAILCMALPYPLTAYSKARDAGQAVVPALISAWTELTTYACTASAEDMNDFALAKIRRDLNTICTSVRGMSGNVDTAWWECLGLGKMQRQRVMLRKLEVVLTENYDRLLATFCICVRDKSPSPMMQRVQDIIFRVVAEANNLLQIGLEAIDAGIVNEEKAQRLRSGAASLRAAYTDLTAEFRRAKIESRIPAISQELLGESAFCLTVCAFGRVVAQWAEELADRNPPTPEAGGFLGLGSLADIFDMSIIMEKSHLSYVARNWLSICIGFYMGYSRLLDFSDGETTRQYNAALASTAAVLLSKAPGGAITRNLARMQGAILGSASGALMYALFGGCRLQALIGLPIVLFSWLCLTLFIYNNSTVNCGLGFLLAYFGTGPMLIGCGKSNSGGLASMVVNLLSTVVVMITVDTIFQGKDTASQQSYNELIASLDQIRRSIAEIFNKDVRELKFGGRVLAALGTAETLGAQANNEPRWYKTPWRHGTFTRSIEMGYNMRYILYGMKYAAVGGSDAGPRCQQLEAALDVAEFQACASRPATRMEQVQDLLSILVFEMDGRGNKYMNIEDDVVAAAASKYDQMVADAVKALNANSAVTQQPQGDSLEQDHTVQISYQLAGLGAMIGECRNLAGGIIVEG